MKYFLGVGRSVRNILLWVTSDDHFWFRRAVVVLSLSALLMPLLESARSDSNAIVVSAMFIGGACGLTLVVREANRDAARRREDGSAK
jgi:hypothetical protein